MKRLDEVITGMTELILSGKTADVKGVMTDALKFLKKYREEDKKLGSAINEAVDTEMQYNHLIEDLERNEPLDWDELHKMIGKPVYEVDIHYGCNFWHVIRNFQMDKLEYSGELNGQMCEFVYYTDGYRLPKIYLNETHALYRKEKK